MRSVLHFDLLDLQKMQLAMRVGQMAISPAAGRASDRYGNRPVLELSQLLVAAGLLFYFVATPAARWWIVGAWILWSAYAGINVCFSNIMLKLAPPRDNAGHIAVFEALGGLTFGLSTIAGGVLLDRLSAVEFSFDRLDRARLLRPAISCRGDGPRAGRAVAGTDR